MPYMPVRSWGLLAVHGVRRASFSGVNFVNFPDVWNLRFCKVRRVNLGQVSGGVGSLSVATIEQADGRPTMQNSISTQSKHAATKWDCYPWRDKLNKIQDCAYLSNATTCSVD